MTEKKVGKAKHLMDPNLITWTPGRADFIESKYSNKKLELFTNWWQIVTGGWGIIFILFSASFRDWFLQTMFYLPQATFFEYKVALAWGGLYTIVLLEFIAALLIIYTITNNLQNEVFQKLLRGKLFYLFFPLSGVYRGIAKLGKKKDANFYFKKEGAHSRKSLNVFVEQFVCADITLEGDYKTHIESIEWSSGNHGLNAGLPVHPAFTKMERIIIPYIFFIFKEFLLGAWCSKRKVTFHFAQVPEKGSLIIETF